MMELKRVLKKLMSEHDLKVTQLARATGVANTTISNWLNGQPPRNVNQVKTVADHFEVTVDYLLFGTETGTRSAIEEFRDEIDAGIFRVILIREKK